MDGVVLAGGGSRRMGGRDKTALQVGGRALLDRAVEALLDAGVERVVVVGPRLPAAPGTRRDRLVLVREDPAGSGPVAGLEAGLTCTDAAAVVVLAADLPLVDGAVVRALHERLVAAGPGDEPPEAVVPVDGTGRVQWLCAAYRTAALRDAVAAALVERPVTADGRGPGLRDVVARLRWTKATDAAVSGRLADVDTPEELSRAHLDAWTVGLAARWGLEPQLAELLDDPAQLVTEVLDVAKDAAHTVARPAAPLTTFLLGVALAARGGDGTGTRHATLAELRVDLAGALAEHRDADPAR